MSVVWLNGVLLDEGVARIDPADRGFTLGDGVFETIRAQSGKTLHLPRHFARLRSGAEAVGIVCTWTDEAIAAAMHDMLAANKLDDAALRLTLTRGLAPRGVLPTGAGQPTMLISAGALPAQAAPARLIVCNTTRRNEHSPLSRIKSLNYLDSILARREAAARGADDALLMNTAGTIAEATAANLVLLLDGRAVTPSTADGALPGIARGLLLQAGWVSEARVAVSMLAVAEGALLVNALGSRLVSSIDAMELDCDHPALRAVAEFLRNAG